MRALSWSGKRLSTLEIVRSMLEQLAQEEMFRWFAMSRKAQGESIVSEPVDFIELQSTSETCSLVMLENQRNINCNVG